MNHRGMQFTVSYRRVKYARIDMREGNLILILPHGTDPNEFVERHEERIRRLYDKVNAIRERALSDIEDGTVELLGRKYRLKEDCDDRVRLEDGVLFFCPRNYRKTREFIKGMLRKELKERIESAEKLTGLRPERFFIREQVTKWGSCSSRGNLNFNLRLAFVPSDFLDYIVLHEALHLRYMNHGKDFKRELKEAYGRPLPTKEEMSAHWFRSSYFMERLGKE